MVIKNIGRKILSNDINRTIIKNSSWLFFGTFLSKTFLLLATIIVARIIGKSEYGEFGIIRSTVSMFMAFAELGLGLTATKFVSEYKKTAPEKVGKIISLSNVFSIFFGLFFTVLIIFFSKEIAVSIKASHLDGSIKISAIILFFSVLNGIQNGVLVGLESYKSLAKNNIVSGFLSLVFQVLGAYQFGLNGLILGFGFHFLILYILNLFSIRKLLDSSFKIKLFSKKNFTELDILWKFSLPAVLSGILVNPIIWLSNYFLVNQPNGYNEMANFDIGNQWRLTILFIPTILAQIALPMLTKNLKDRDNYKDVFYQNLKINFIVSTFFVIGIVFLSPLILKLYGDQYKDAIGAFIVIMITTGILAINNVVGQVLASKSKMWLAFFINLIWGSIMVFCSYILIVRFNMGALGLSLSYLISYISHTFVQFTVCKKYIKI